MVSDEPRQSPDETRFRIGVIGFYAACTVVGVAAAIAAMAWIVFPDQPGMETVGTVAAIATVGAGVASWYFLAISRRER
jgi:hypothetical protein